MKIGYDAKRFFHNTSGLGNYSRDLVRILSDFFSDHQYLMFAKNSSQNAQKLLERHNIVFKKISPGKFGRQTQMGKDAQNEGCSIFHGLSGELPLRWNQKEIKKIVTIHDLIFLKYPQFYSFFDRHIHRWKFLNATRNADLVLAISEQTKQDLITYFKTPESKIRVIYQTCHTAFKQSFSAEEIEHTRERLGLPKRFILNVGSIEERKNIFSVVKALEGTDIHLVIVGKSTAYTQRIYKFIKQHKMGEQIHFLKNVNMLELAHIYRLAEVFIYPSLYEGFGIPIIEAIFSKTPVITSHLSCLPEAGGPHSLYIDPFNIEDIKSKILHLWGNPEEGKRRAEKSFRFVQKFHEKQIAEDLMHIYEEVLKL
ncbi:glycosyltransferase [Elizabethkingia argentiflava]|uniref:Glycosyltransferase n=1 Tax=Elizabethkingia argenteiflava TaxID=2681556 RepID=A0A845PTA0_9FLAO|nr:glycosyltransferase family 1 protein [Elizabethkingia argenteiflava]NAW50261.1 glycosyltransferase [Elizabethkingia argenteiflava]